MENRTIILSDGRKVSAPSKPTEGPKLSRSIIPAQPSFNTWMQEIYHRNNGAANWPVRVVHYLNVGELSE